MNFYVADDTIAQVASPPGRSHCGVLRISGPGAFAVVGRVFAPADGRALAFDRGMREGSFSLTLLPFAKGIDPAKPQQYSCPAWLAVFPAPGSYTSEPMAEVHLPGSPVILRAALAELLAAGARAAEPGEFTFRAFRRGRLSLGHAEAVGRLIAAEKDADRRSALARMNDSHEKEFAGWREMLLSAAARLEAVLDFDDEELGADVAEGLGAEMADLASACERLAGQAKDVLRAGAFRIGLAGLTNAGKSALFNRLTGSAALVSAEPSTTRDRLEARIALDGNEAIVDDLPGHDGAATGAGAEAVRRAGGFLGVHDVTCWVVDGHGPVTAELRDFASRLRGSVLVLLNKADLSLRTDVGELRGLLAAGADCLGALAVSAVTGEGLEELRRKLTDLCRGIASSGGYWSVREAGELRNAADACRRAAQELSGASRLELAAEDVRLAASAIGRLAGENYAEETLERIFSTFCLGK